MRCERLSQMAPEIESIGVDTWGVDFALLDAAGALVQNPVHYRDARTDGMPDRVFSIVTADEIYENTGVQFMQINTLFQVFALAERHPDLLQRRELLPHHSGSVELLAHRTHHLRIHERHHYADVRHTGAGLGAADAGEARITTRYPAARHRTRHGHRTAASRTREGDGDRAGVSRHGFRGCGDRSRRRHGVYQFRHLVLAGYGSAGAHCHSRKLEPSTSRMKAASAAPRAF